MHSLSQYINKTNMQHFKELYVFGTVQYHRNISKLSATLFYNHYLFGIIRDSRIGKTNARAEDSCPRAPFKPHH